MLDPQLAAKAFAPGYGAVLGAAHAASASLHGTRQVLLAAQCAMLLATTLLTFALSRRVLFGYSALIPAALITASVALLELPGGMAPWIPVMLLLVAAVWLLTVLHERLAGGLRGASEMLLTVLAGLVVGAAILFNPAVLLLAVPLCWWAFRGIGREHATLLLVATILLPACWLAVVQSQVTGGIPTDQVTAWFDSSSGNVPDSPASALDRAYAVATPWNPRFARGEWSSTNWNYEWLLPFSARSDTNYLSATRVLSAVWMIGFALLVLAGIVALFAEGAGSPERLIALGAIVMPLVTFVSPMGNLLRVPALPFLMIALTIGAGWAIEALRRAPQDT